MTAPGPAAPPPHPVLPGQDGAPPPGVPARREPGVPAAAGPGWPRRSPRRPPRAAATRLWLGLGVGALAVLLCCGGGGAAVVGLAVSNVQAIEEQGRTVTDDYYQALVEQAYGAAYDQLCDDAQRRESRPEFERRVAAEPQIASVPGG